jgi:hypothetical protein
MTEAEWLSSYYSSAMLEHLRDGQRINRKIRLFAAGCIRQVWDSINTAACRRAVETAERFAEGSATIDELHRARDSAMNSINTWSPRAARTVEEGNLVPRLKIAASSCVRQTNGIFNLLGNLRLDSELDRMAPVLLRCVFGPEPGRAFLFDPEWLTSTVETLAQSTYEDRDFDILPILGDALEEAGCSEIVMLQHCRASGPHIRGCWVVDLVLGKS